MIRDARRMTTQVTSINNPFTHVDSNAAAHDGAAPVWFIGGIAYVDDAHPMLVYYRQHPTVYTITTGATAPPAYLAAVAADAADRGLSSMIGGPEIDGAGNVPVYPRFP